MKRRWEQPDWAGLTVFVLALMIAVVVCSDVLTATFGNRDATEAEGRFLAGIIGAAIGVVSTYVGGGFVARRQGSRSKHQAPGAVRGDQGAGQQAGEPAEQVQGGSDQQRGGQGSGGAQPHGQEGGGHQEEAR